MATSLKERLRTRRQALTGQRIGDFQARYQEQYGRAHLDLACHAAFPLALTPDLLYTIWVNFDRDTGGHPLNIPWIAVADVLLSDLCREVGFELYEMVPAVRAALLQRLDEDPRFRPVAPGQPSRSEELATFLRDYANNLLRSARQEDVALRQLARSQRWAALAYLEPATAAAELVEAFQEALAPGDHAEILHLAELTNSFATRLDAFEPLLPYARSMAAYARGETRAAASGMAALSSQEVAGKTLAVPPELEEAVDDARSVFLVGGDELERLAPGISFRVVWQVKNAGTTTWDASYTLRQVGGEPAASGGTVPGVPAVPPGEQASLPLELQAPAAPGRYAVDWRLHNELGQPFGDTLTVHFAVFLPLSALLAREFDMNGVIDLAFDLGIDPDNLGGATLEKRSRELVGYMTRRERLGELLEAIARKRPSLDMGVYDPGRATQEAAPVPETWSELIASAFNLEELALLAFDLGVDVTALDGDTVPDKAQALRQYLQRRGRLGELLWQVGRHRPHLDLSPYGQPRPPGESPPPADPNQLYQLLVESFNLEELRELCFQLDVDFDNIAGETRRDKARELVLYMRRRQRYQELLLALAGQRPHLDLDPFFQATGDERESARSLGEFRQLLVESFSLEELALLSFDLGLYWAEISTGTLVETAAQLIEHARRVNRFDDLVQAVAAARPRLDLSAFASEKPAARPLAEPLYQLLDGAYNLQELQRLCFELAVEYENLEGETKIRKLMELQKMMQQRHRLPELLEAVARERPHLDLSPYGYTPEAEPSPSEPLPPVFVEPFDFAGLISENAGAVAEQMESLAETAHWLNVTAPQVLLFTGEPGSGKLALAATLAAISQGDLPPPGGLDLLRSGFLSAIHFCDPQQPDTLVSARIVEALAAQMGNRYPAYARHLRRALAESGGSSTLPNVPPPFEQSLAGAPDYVPPDDAPLRLETGELQPDEALHRFFLEPLREMFAAGNQEPVVILIAGLENALRQEPEPHIAERLSAISGLLPEGVRFIFTSRPLAELDTILRSADVQRFNLEPPPTEPFIFRVWPTEHRQITQPFGANPNYYKQYGLPGHDGVDITAPEGSAVYAVAPGTVSKVGSGHGYYGTFVRIAHRDGYQSQYAHLQEPLVEVGERVEAQHLIGRAGSSGGGRGGYLHLSLSQEGATYQDYPANIIDPTPFLAPLLAPAWERPEGPYQEGWVAEQYVFVWNDLAQVVADRLNVRAGPSATEPQLVTVERDALLIVRGEPENGFLPVGVPEAAPTPSPAGVDSNREMVYEALLTLDYEVQIGAFDRFLVSGQQLGAFLIHGPPEHGQRWLVHRLLRRLDSSPPPMTYSLRAEEILSWPQGASTTVLVNLEPDAPEATIAETISRARQERDVFLLVEMGKLPPPEYPELIDVFWKPMVQTASRLGGDGRLLLFMTVNQVVTSDLIAEPSGVPIPAEQVLRLPPLTRFTEDQLVAWLGRGELPGLLAHVIPVTSAQDILHEILAETDDGVPERVMDYVCRRYDFSWSEFRSWWEEKPGGTENSVRFS